MVWPYLLLYTSQKLNQPLTAVAGLMTLNSVVGMVTTFIGGAIADRFGRKWVMVFSLVFSGVSWFFFRLAGTLPIFALLMALTGASTPLYRLASDAMIADMIPPDKRLDAYSLLRMGNNIGVALGPAIGGFLAAISYNISFTAIGVGLAACAILVGVFATETNPEPDEPQITIVKPVNSYLKILKDKTFMTVLTGFTLNRICVSTLWLMLAIYAKQNFEVSERLFGFIPMTNALMVIFFQLVVTRWIKRRKPEPSMALGALIYAGAIFSVAFGQGFWGFWLCMVFATIGEMILVPTTTTFTSRLSPEKMRARYMSAYALTWGIGTALGPLLGGILSDTLGPKTMWYGVGLIGFAGALVFFILSRQRAKRDRMEGLLAQGSV